MSRIAQKTLAIVATAAFATAGPLVMAQAQEAPNTNQASTPQGQQVQGIDVNAAATLTIEKREGEVGSTTPASGEFKFNVERIRLSNNLDTVEGWNEVSTIVNDPTKANPTGEATTITTSGNGTGSADLPVGLYRVTEVQTGNFTVAAPFFVTLPLNDEDGTLDYNPTIYPKTQNVEPTITADDTNKGIGDNINYTINAPVPAGDVLQDGTRTIGNFEIVTTAGEGLAPVEGSVKVVLTGNKPGESLVESEDYTITVENGTVKVEFTEKGREKLAELRKDNPNLGVEVTFDSEVTSIPKNGVVGSEVSVTIPNGGDPIKKNTSTQYVDVKVTNPLGDVKPEDATGSEFNIIACTKQEDGSYKVTADAKPLNHTNKDGMTKLDGPIKSVESNGSIEALGYGLQFTPGKDGQPAQQYCAVQTKAPKGLIVNPTLTPLTEVQPAGERPVYTTSIENTVKNNLIGRLPATGERTMLALLAIGLVLFAGGAAYQLRRKNAEA